MKAVIDKILKEEEQARKNIDSARAKATEMIDEANKEAKKRSEDVLLGAANLAKQKKEQAEKEFLAEKNKLIQRTKEEAVALRQQKEKNVSEITEKVFSEIISIK
jgi:vacuolar-type H+-ATPase subunit H